MNERNQVITFLLQSIDTKDRMIIELQQKLAAQESAGESPKPSAIKLPKGSKSAEAI